MNLLEKLENKMNEISQLFVKEVKFTLIARLPADAEADVVLTQDDLKEVRDAIDRSIEREELK